VGPPLCPGIGCMDDIFTCFTPCLPCFAPFYALLCRFPTFLRVFTRFTRFYAFLRFYAFSRVFTLLHVFTLLTLLRIIMHSRSCSTVCGNWYTIGHLFAPSIGLRLQHFIDSPQTITEVHLCHGLVWLLAASHQVSAGLRFSHHLQFLHFPHISCV
jgi:hypothetical protein